MTYFPGYRPAWAGACAVAVLLASACSTTLSTKVTNFNAWPSDAAGSSFAFTPRAVGATGAARELEQSTYEQYVREALERLGLKPAASGASARFVVDVQADGSQRTVRSLQPVYQNYRVFVPSRPGPNGTVVPGYWSADMVGGQYLGDREVARTVQVSRLKVQMRDRKASQASPPSVFESTAVYEGGMENLPDLVPFLAKAVFDDFPGRNGQTREVRFDTGTDQLGPIGGPGRPAAASAPTTPR